MNGFVCLFIGYQTLMYVVLPCPCSKAHFTKTHFGLDMIHAYTVHTVHIPTASLSGDRRISCLLLYMYIFARMQFIFSNFIRQNQTINGILSVERISQFEVMKINFVYICV